MNSIFHESRSKPNEFIEQNPTLNNRSQSSDIESKTQSTTAVATPTSYPDAATLQNKKIYDTYLFRLNEESEFSKSLAQQQLNNCIVTPLSQDQNDSAKCEHKAVSVTPTEERPPISDHERERIRIRYKEKARDRRLRMYQKAILLAEERETEEGKRYRAQRILHFRVIYETYFGQNVFVVGSASPLGNWDIEKAIPLTWCPGNLWTGTVTVSVDDGLVEYKYVVKDVNTNQVEWEPGFNHRIDGLQLAATTSLDDTWGRGGSSTK